MLKRIGLITLALAAAAPLAAQEHPRELHRAIAEAHRVAAQAEVAAAHAHQAIAAAPVALAALEATVSTVVPHALAMVEAMAPAADLVLADLAHVSDALAHAADDVVFHATTPLPPEAWAPQDPADSLWRSARRALNDGEYARAAALYARIRQDARYRGSEYRAASYYWEAFARQRMGGPSELQRARNSLTEMRRLYAAEYRDQKDAPALLARIESDLARTGDARAAQAMTSRADAVSRNPCNDPNMAVKIETLNALLQMDADNALPILEEIMKKKDTCTVELRRKAIFLVAQKPSARTADLLLDAVRNDPDPQVQENAVFWLSQVNSEEAVKALQQILATSQNRKLQERALFAVSQHPSAHAHEILRSYALRADVPADLRGNAIFFIGQQQGPESARFLREIYPKLGSREAKEKVLFSMMQQHDAASGQWLFDRAMDPDEDMEIRKNALFFAGQKEALPLDRLSELYGRMTTGPMKEQLIFVLSQRISEPAAVDKLMDIAKNEQDPELRKRAIFWLGQSKDPRVSKFLLDLIRN